MVCYKLGDRSTKRSRQNSHRASPCNACQIFHRLSNRVAIFRTGGLIRTILWVSEPTDLSSLYYGHSPHTIYNIYFLFRFVSCISPLFDFANIVCIYIQNCVSTNYLLFLAKSRPLGGSSIRLKKKKKNTKEMQMLCISLEKLWLIKLS